MSIQNHEEPTAARVVGVDYAAGPDRTVVSDRPLNPLELLEQEVEKLRANGTPDAQIITALIHRCERGRQQLVMTHREKDDRITSLWDQNQRLEEQYKTLTGQYEDLAEVMEASCTRQNGIIDNFMAELENRRVQLNAVMEENEVLAADAEGLRDRLEREQQMVEKLQAVIREKNREIAHLSETLNSNAMAHVNEVAGLTTRLGQQEARIISLTSTIAERDAMIADLRHRREGAPYAGPSTVAAPQHQNRAVPTVEERAQQQQGGC